MAVSLGELAARFGCKLAGDPAKTVARVATLTAATGDALAFLANPAYREQLAATAAGAVIVKAEDANRCPVDPGQ